VQAIIHSGERRLAVVSLGEGRFQPREIEIGVEADGFYQVINGLREGDRIVTSSQFLIDSESNLKAAVGAMVSESAAGVKAMVGESTDAVSGDEGHDH
jgi:Cu(I)/Ag(I) efflux system membrane fusion protein